MGKRGEAMKDATQRARVRQMIEARYSVAKIMKELGTSYAHTVRLVEQERTTMRDDLDDRDDSDLEDWLGSRD